MNGWYRQDAVESLGGQAGKSGMRCHAKQALPGLKDGEDVL